MGGLTVFEREVRVGFADGEPSALAPALDVDLKVQSSVTNVKVHDRLPEQRRPAWTECLGIRKLQT